MHARAVKDRLKGNDFAGCPRWHDVMISNWFHNIRSRSNPA